jgi:hypothetical protein
MLAILVAGCGGTPNTPSGSTVNSGGSPATPPPQLIGAAVIVSVPRASHAARRAHYVSPRTQSVAIAIASASGIGISNGKATTIDVGPHAAGCKTTAKSIVCSGAVDAVPGDDVFNVTTFAGPDGTGPVLSAGTVEAPVSSSGGSVAVSPLSLTLDGIPAALKLAIVPSSAKIGTPGNAKVALTAYDAAGAAIVGASDFATPVTLSIQGDAVGAFTLHAGTSSGSTLAIESPAQAIELLYDGNKSATGVTLQAAIAGSGGSSATATFALRGTVPPPVAGEIYALNIGSTGAPGGTVTVYHANASGNAAPIRSLTLDAKLYPQSIALDAQQRLYVGYTETPSGVNIANGSPEPGNEIAIYAAGATGSAAPVATLAADAKSGTTLFPVAMAFDGQGELVTYGATNVDGNTGSDAALIYAAGASGAVAPADAWGFASPYFYYPGPTGLALDAGGNFYVAGTLKTSLSPQSGVYVAAAADRSTPNATAARILPWDSGTGLFAGEAGQIGLDASGEIYVANFTRVSGGCQAQSSVYAAGATGGTTDVPPLRTATIAGLLTTNPLCTNPDSVLAAHFPALAIFGAFAYAADDFDNAIAVFSTGSSGRVTPKQTISGSATNLNAPIGLAIAPSPQPAKR